MGTGLPRRAAGTTALAVAAVLMLGGCQIVSRVVMAEPSPGAVPALAATCVLLTVAPPGDGTDPAETLAATGSVINDRLAGSELRYVEVSTISPDRILVGLPAGDDTRWRRLAEATGLIEFIPVPPAFNQQVEDGRPLPEGMDATPIFDGSVLTDASISEDQLGQPAVSLSMDAAGAAAFDAFAAAHYGERFAIVLDGVVLSSPSINATEFNGRAQISGAFDQAAIEDLVAIIASGRLPTAVTEAGVAPAVDGTCSLGAFAG